MLTNTLYGNLLCSVAIDTTGPYPDQHDMIQVCIVPLDRTFGRDRQYPIFLAMMKPNHDFPDVRNYHGKAAYKYPHVYTAKKSDYLKALTHGADSITVADAMERWFKSLGLAENKRIAPLAYDWPFIGRHLRKLLGDEDFDRMFDYRHRDLLSICLAENDNAAYNLRDIPFIKQDFSFVSTRMGVRPDAHGALQLSCPERALKIGEIYMAYQLQRNTWR